MPRRRPKSLKFHAMALASICVVVVILYLLIVPKPAPPPGEVDTGDRYVHVVDASWGLNCNVEINRLIAAGRTKIGEGDNARPLKLVQPNNAIYAVTEACNDKLVCNIIASNDTLGGDPLSSCYKQLVVGYRCFGVDRKWTKKVDQGALLTIDCNADVDQQKVAQ